MAKKLTKYNDNLALVLDKEIVEALGIDQKSNLEMIVIDDVLIIKPKDKANASEKRKAKLKDVANKLMDEYEPVLKKLAKT